MIYQKLSNPIIVHWDLIKCFLPQGWRQRSKRLPGIGKKASTTRCDEFLQLAIIHLGNNLSFKDTMRVGRSLKIRSFTPKKFLECLESSGEWFQWMASELAARHLGRQIPSLQGERGKQFLLHTSIVQGKSIAEVKKLIQFRVDINSLECSFLRSNSPNEECQISWFPISRNSTYLGHWQLKNREMIEHITKNKGHVITSIPPSQLELVFSDAQLEKVKKHFVGEVKVSPKAFELKIPSADKQEHSIEGRLCGIPKSPAMAYNTNLLSNDISSLKFPNLLLEQDINFPRRDTRSLDLQFHLMFTTLDLNTSFSDIAEMYRQFWVIEKILKKMNPLPAQGFQEKSERGATLSILKAHIFLAFLMEALMESGPRHTPWGYAVNEPNRD